MKEISNLIESTSETFDTEKPDIYKISDSKEPPWKTNKLETQLNDKNDETKQNPNLHDLTRNILPFTLEPISDYAYEIKFQDKGGSYGEIIKETPGTYREVHHIPADSTTDLPYKDGPAISMRIDDHEKTASYGNSREAKEYRQKQRELIEQGKFDEAVQMDIDDIHEKFGNKYDNAIAEMKEYVKILKEEDRV